MGSRGASSVSASRLLIFPFAPSSKIAPHGSVTVVPLFKMLVICSLWVFGVISDVKKYGIKYYLISITEFFDAPLNFVPGVST